MWHKVVVKNDWENLSYTLNGKSLAGGELLMVKWPDGGLSAVDIERERFYTSAYDHGHTYPVETFKLFFIHQIHGLNVKIYLTEDLEFSFLDREAE